jgi:hypothetical protein
MAKGKFSEADLGTARCGRCTEILPDETQSFCRYCGIAFSNVPPVTSYVLLAERGQQVESRQRRIRVAGLSLFVLFGLWGFSVFLSALELRASLTDLSSMRRIVFYTHDFPEFPALPKSLRRQSLATAVQAFEDHFGLSLAQIEIREDEIPLELQQDLQGGWAQEAVPPARDATSPMHLSFWENFVFRRITGTWERRPQAELPVFVTNLPLFWDKDTGTNIETKHLSRDGLVSGLAHPGMVIVSTYRMLNDRKDFAASHLPVKTDADKVKHLGEYLIAHELGHALLGLHDFVVSKGEVDFRSPASVGRSPTCLMHTDEGGGFAAWSELKKRPLGQTSSCHSYDNTLDAFHKRALAIARLRNGERAEAEALHLEAINLVTASSQDWVAGAWRREHRLFLPAFRRWISGFFMF